MENMGHLLSAVHFETSIGAIGVILLRSVLVAIIGALLWHRWVYHHCSGDRGSNLPLPPGSMGVPLLGENLNLALHGVDFFKSRRERYGEVYKTHILGSPTIRVMGAENVRKVLMGEHNLVATWWPSSVRQIMGGGALFNSYGDAHRLRRRVTQKAFRYQALLDFTPTVHVEIQRHLRRWRDEGVIDTYKECKMAAFRLAVQTLSGYTSRDEDEISKLLREYDTMTNNLFSLPVRIPGLGLDKGLKARECLHDLLDDVIRRKIREDNADPDSHDALGRILHHILSQNREGLDVTALKEGTVELLFAGHETVASTLCSMVRCLALYPDILSRMRRELEENGLMVEDEYILGRLSLQKVQSLRYVSQVIKEVLRLWPPIGGGYRKVIKTFTLNGFQIPKDWTLIYSIRDTHETTDLFHNLNEFNPDRWRCESDRTREMPFHFLPFGGGPRTCIGKEYAQLVLKIFAIEMSRTCQLSIVPPVPPVRQLPSPRPDGILMVRVSPHKIN